MQATPVVSTSPQCEAPAFPYRTVLIFVAGACILRIGAVAAWGLFPRTEGLQAFVRVAVPLLFTGTLVALNRWCLRRDGFAPTSLGLEFHRVGWFAAGAVAMTPILLLIAAVMGWLVPFHWERGAITGSQWSWQFGEYIAGNSGEELIFRGYLLLVLWRHMGLGWALAIMAALFGLFHVPGLSALAALKMAATTATGGLIFAAGFLLSGSLWTAIGMHAWGNIFLHHCLGLSGRVSFARPVWEEPWPSHYDPALVTWLVVTVPCAVFLLLLVRKRRLPGARGR